MRDGLNLDSAVAIEDAERATILPS